MRMVYLMRLGTALHSVAVVNRGINHTAMDPTPDRAARFYHARAFINNDSRQRSEANGLVLSMLHYAPSIIAALLTIYVTISGGGG